MDVHIVYRDLAYSQAESQIGYFAAPAVGRTDADFVHRTFDCLL